jgi:hypothetical protein
MWTWFARNAAAVQAVAAAATAIVALGALVVIPWQIGEAERIQREQAARDIYREFLNVTIQHPAWRAADWCAIEGTPPADAYEAYVEYLLYTAEQVVSTDADWREPMGEWIGEHMGYVCARGDWNNYAPEVRRLIDDFRARACASATPCPAQN